KAVKACAAERIKVNVTLCFSALQALFAAKAGAAFVSPFVGRIDDTGHDGLGLIRDIVQIYRNYGYATEVLVASIRHPIHVLEAAKAGAHVATMPFSVFDKLIRHPLTDRGVELFLEDYRKIPR
ncbi:MAG: transaldolase family protein, partial [Planctomycetota bacterium]